MPHGAAAPARRAVAEPTRRISLLHEDDLRAGFGDVYLPYAHERKYPAAARERAWQYVFPAHKLSVEPRAGVTRRHHASPDNVQREVKRAFGRAGITKRQPHPVLPGLHH